ncbi:DM2 domain-containing protein [Caenorhabditis elegans]|uniref:DM2 domain-containing protein n=1 Tax=Caenorhabditis elegans TaxID=6239 RepID=Q22749_CAEEL|nr:DM2 domain-containing protein [Caenorhabditis elegans]CCD71519.1 DM2 domain-containing protein [Caenorhabditis elegans]|eukprot:NP_498159.2 Uncharacterized protein CELE_T24G10.2 [Caenorhabditis elegans]
MTTEEPISSFPMDKEAAEEEIALLVRKPGFDELTPSDIVRHMNNRFNINFDSYKSQLKKMVIEEIKKRNDENGSDSSDDGGTDSDSDHEEGEEKKEKTEKVKKEELPVKAKKEVKEDSDSDSGVEDAVMDGKKRGKKTTTRIPPDMASSIKSTRRAAASDALKQIRNTSEGGRFANNKKKKVKDPNADMSGVFGPMTKLCYISTELQQVTKDQWMKRCDVVKALWDYIKENNLKDPKNGQYIICDSTLESIFKKNRLKGFGMVKFLTRHIIGTSDMAPEMREEAEAEMDKRRKEWKERQAKKREADLDANGVADDEPEPKKPKKEEVEDDEDEKKAGSSSSDDEDSD